MCFFRKVARTRHIDRAGRIDRMNRRYRIIKKTLPLCFLCSLAFAGTALSGEWKQDQGGWWYQNEDGSYPVSAWVWIDGNGDGAYECYAFDAQGYLYTNTVTPDNYAVDAGGAWVDHGITVSRAFLGEAAKSTPIGSYAASLGLGGGATTGGTNATVQWLGGSAGSTSGSSSDGNGSSGGNESGTSGSVITVRAGRSDTDEEEDEAEERDRGSNTSSGSGSSRRAGDSSNSSDIQIQRTDGILRSGGSSSEEEEDEEDSGKGSKKRSSNTNNASTAEQMDPTESSGNRTEAGGPSGNMTSDNSFGTPTADKGTADLPGKTKDTVYWEDGGSTYHKDSSCSAIRKHGDDLYAGTLQEALRNDATEACSICVR